jgi:hypothetical protein
MSPAGTRVGAISACTEILTRAGSGLYRDHGVASAARSSELDTARSDHGASHEIRRHFHADVRAMSGFLHRLRFPTSSGNEKPSNFYYASAAQVK